MSDSLVPPEVLAAYRFDALFLEPLSGGLINETFAVCPEPDAEPIAVLQKLHPIFEPEVNLDIDAISGRLVEAGMTTPTLIRTADGQTSFERWRALTFVRGLSFDSVVSENQAESAGALIGRFHSELDDWNYQFQFARAGVHDTPKHLAELRKRLGQTTDVVGARELAERILAAPLSEISDFPKRICHGDLKISNIRFDAENEEKAICLLDLDTLGWQTLAFELGDAMRSWCNRSLEDEAPSFDQAIFVAAMRGYRRSMPDSISAAELDSVVAGLETVCVELAARFCADIWDDSYFGWDPNRHPSRTAHNLARATAMIDLADVVGGARSQLLEALETGLR